MSAQVFYSQFPEQPEPSLGRQISSRHPGTLSGAMPPLPMASPSGCPPWVSVHGSSGLTHTHTHCLLCLDSTPHLHPILLANLLILCSTRQICGQNLRVLVVSCDWEHREHSGPQGDCPAPPLHPPGFLPRFFRAGTITVLSGISCLLVTVGSRSPELSAPAGYNI